VYTRIHGVWHQQGTKLVGTGAIGDALQGTSVALSDDGNTAIVGGYDDNGGAGAAWVYTRKGGLSDGVWSQQGAKLVGRGAVGGAAQGVSVGLSGDGNTAIVGGIHDNSKVGAAWVYTRKGGLSDGVWYQQGAKLVGRGAVGGAEDPPGVFARGAGQGFSVALSGDGNTAMVGGILDNNFAGATWVYTRIRGAWYQQGAKLVDTGAASAEQGRSVSLSADGNTAIVGGLSDNDHTGAAWVYTRIRDVWHQQGAKLVGKGAVGGAAQGISVALSGDGNTAIVGGHLDNGEVGAAWLYTRSGGLSDGVWSQQGAKLVGTGAIGGAAQGYSVSLSGDGHTAIVGGVLDNNLVGAAWVYTRSAFAGTPGKASCYAKSVSALLQQYKGLNAAAAALGFPSVRALQNAIREFCEE
jgi:hypothetical protein